MIFGLNKGVALMTFFSRSHEGVPIVHGPKKDVFIYLTIICLYVGANKNVS